MLVVVADQHRCQLYEVEELGKPWTNIESLLNPSSAVAEHNLGSDAPGRSMNRASGTHQAYDAAEPIHHEAMRKFARDIADALGRRTSDSKPEAIALVAAPHLLSDIKSSCSARVRAAIKLELPKDLAHEPLPDLSARLKAAARELL